MCPLVVYRLKLPPHVSSILLLFHIFTVPHLLSHANLEVLEFAGTKEIQRLLLFEFLNVRQPLLLNVPRLLLQLLSLSLYDQEAGSERSGVRGACLLTSE